MPTISDLFDLAYGHSLELNRLKRSNAVNAINFVSRAARNNGVTARVVQVPGLAPAPAGTITVALNGQGGAGVAFLQPIHYYCGFHVMVLTPKVQMTEAEKLWWATCITANRFRFGFGRQANRTLKDLVLPDPSEMPDWVQRADFSRFDGCAKSLDARPIAVLGADQWQSFRYDEIFEIRNGYYNKKPPTTDNAIGVPFIGATEYQNGITSYVALEDVKRYSRDGTVKSGEALSRKLFPGACITVTNNGSVGEAFYQADRFTCSHDVNPLYLKDRTVQLTPALGLFLATVIRAEKYRWGYGRKWRPIRMPSSRISVPVTQKGNPDWQLMEQYIESLPFSSKIS
ncbi:restriction endonuclease subunit S [Bordetella sp. LUAb4]|uniref:restriction endonuclease subunit S n=1 Tax=Bordetella sp. LUAb4 TaxID=2843195 RepID=UPI001E2F8F84|nr:restriction endonuclease subunit S [Bordetella sp. LUAb4]